MSFTHGVETHSLATAITTMPLYQNEPLVEILWRQGERRARGIERTVAAHRLQGYVGWLAVYITRNEKQQSSQPFCTLFLQEIIERGLLASRLVVST